MSIIRVIAIDPRPRNGESDIVVYQVPERSRAYELLVELMGGAGVEWVEIGSPPRKPKVMTLCLVIQHQGEEPRQRPCILPHNHPGDHQWGNMVD